ncbi:receptor-like protein kinase At3g21340 [Neltuma alba]|uniref:receptor-like protein kinase At3g21340 n=1 Tax=Neltuma alba TaxID=207710 RepID=UPI0010A3949F|nr:receptor-like protein kinase At3g21340 [Prosopis alba]
MDFILRESQKREAVKHKSQSFSYSEVLRITNNFETAIGEGGFGKVYLGTLEDATKVAVKLLSPSSRQGFKEFQLEAQLLTVIHHRNLVSFIGFCNENDIKALVYEYMDLGDLSGLLAGLEYLHHGCKTPIIHRDLKPSNILLNQSRVAKLADFGLSRAFKNERDTHLSTQPAGTPGYIDPEFQMSGNVNKESDIYSFGMILLQLITGHPPVRRELEDICFIIDWICPKIECGDIQGIVDLRLAGEFNVSSAWKAVETAMSSIAPRCAERPDISYVLHELKECLAMEIGLSNSNGMPCHPINHSGNLDSITILSAR